MPEYFTALVYALALSLLAFALTHGSIAALAGKNRARVWMAIWMAITISLFLTRNFWIFLMVSGFVLLFSRKWERDGTALYALVMAVAPVALISIPGFGGIKTLANITPQDFFAIILLLPALFAARISGSPALSSRWPMFLLTTYFLLTMTLTLRDTTLTDTLRVGLSSFLGMMLLFMAFSHVDSTEKITAVAAAFVLSALPLSLIGCFELAKTWHVYLPAVVDWMDWNSAFSYLLRGDVLRAYASTGRPIALGFIFMTGIGLCLGLPRRLLGMQARLLLIGVLTVGLISPLSRGPWFGAVTIVGIFLLTGRNPIGNFLKFIAVGGVFIAVLPLLPNGSHFIDMIPYVGAPDSTETVDYRRDLLDNSWIVIMRNPFFGSVGYLQTGEMQEMMQGQGIIDIVNTYLQVALEFGLVGAGLFILFFASILFSLARAIMSLEDRDAELKTMARALFATLLGALITISSVSSVGQIPYIYWMLAGLCVAQTRLIRIHLDSHVPASTRRQRRVWPATTTPKIRPSPGNAPRHVPMNGKLDHG